jgi:hypothetical protein
LADVGEAEAEEKENCLFWCEMNQLPPQEKTAGGGVASTGLSAVRHLHWTENMAGDDEKC